MEVDYGEALRLLRLAAESHDSRSTAHAARALAHMYLHGQGVTPDPDIARIYATVAAHKGLPVPGFDVDVEHDVMPQLPPRDEVMTRVSGVGVVRRLWSWHRRGEAVRVLWVLGVANRRGAKAARVERG